MCGMSYERQPLLIREEKTMNHLPTVLILVLNWNGADVTHRCIASLINSTKYPKDKIKILVVDNGSNDDSVGSLTKKFSASIEILALETNLFFILGNNKGINYGMQEYAPHYILLLNNDTEVSQENWLLELVNTAQGDERVGVVGPRLLFPNGRVQWSGRRKESSVPFLIFQTISAGLNPGVGKEGQEADCSKFIGEVNTISGACMLVKAELFHKLGLLDERLIPMFGEDVEYSFRAWRAGYRVVYRGDIDIIHYESYSIEKFKLQMQKNKTYWALRNGVTISRTYFGFARTILFGLPIFATAALLDKRVKTKGLKLGNIKLRQGFFTNVALLFKAIWFGLCYSKTNKNLTP
jgi:GT2 family glycosyltransferase